VLEQVKGELACREPGIPVDAVLHRFGSGTRQVQAQPWRSRELGRSAPEEAH
jgi:hypothetical protein